MRGQASEMLGSLSLLHQGIVSKDLVNFTQLDRSFNEVSDELLQ